MKILKTAIDWMERWDNFPRYIVTVDDIKKLDSELLFREYEGCEGQTFYFSDNTDFIFYYLHDTRDEDGYCGRVFTLNMEDGSTRKVKGPWSSNAMAASKVTGIPCVEAVVYVGEGKFAPGFSGYNIRRDLAKRICDEHDVHMIDLVGGENIDRYGDHFRENSVPSLDPDKLVKWRKFDDWGGVTHERFKKVYD